MEQIKLAMLWTAAKNQLESSLTDKDDNLFIIHKRR